MALRRGISLALTPRFHSALSWIDRVQVNGGVVEEAGHFSPRRDWRRPHETELALLLAEQETARQPPADGAAPDARSPSARAGLINLPPHLRRAWWALADAGPPGAGDGYRAFADDVVEFLRFKRVPLPARCRLDAVVSRSGQPSTRGLAFSLADGATGADRVEGIINLGDEASHLVFLNLTPAAMAGMLELPRPAEATPPADLLRRFFEAWPGYPLVRVRLAAGDGLWLPATGVAYDICTLDKREVDVALTVLAETGAPPAAAPARL